VQYTSQNEEQENQVIKNTETNSLQDEEQILITEEQKLEKSDKSLESQHSKLSMQLDEEESLVKPDNTILTTKDQPKILNETGKINEIDIQNSNSTIQLRSTEVLEAKEFMNSVWKNAEVKHTLDSTQILEIDK
jgi:hypothetical protein